MTSEVTQAALEPCPNPWCNSRKTVDCEIRAAEAPILMPSRSSAEWAVACPVCPLQTPYFDTEVEAIAAWNTRLTAQSGEGRSGAGEDGPTTAIISGLWLDILEKDDRTSPEEYPDMALITEEEFAGSIRYALAALNARQSGEWERGQ